MSIEEDVVTFKGGEQVKFAPIQHKLITDKKVTAKELKDKKLQYFQALVLEAFDTLDMDDETLAEWIKLVMKKWDEDKWNKILELLGVKGFNEITYKTIIKR